MTFANDLDAAPAINLSKFGCVHYHPSHAAFVSFALTHVGDVGGREYIRVNQDGSAVAYFLSEGFGRAYGHVKYPAGTVPVITVRPKWVGEKQGSNFDKLFLNIPGRDIPRGYVKVS